MADKTRAGFAAIIGAPNSGKSTLLNRLVGQKISIVSPKAQTTRMRVVGIVTETGSQSRLRDANEVRGAQSSRGPAQMGLIDTPGIFTASSRLDRAMVDAAWESLEGADAILLLVDAAARGDQGDGIIAELRRRKLRVTLALNKVDKIKPEKLLPLAAALNASGIVADIFMISALTGDGVDDLKKHLLGKMPEGPLLFPEDEISDLPTRLLAAEITREQLYRQLQQELPYAATVIPESWETKKDGSAVIRQTILVAREGHKPIVLGKGGARIKAIGSAARRKIEQLTGARAHLFLDVKVNEKWREDPALYRLFGLKPGG